MVGQKEYKLKHDAWQNIPKLGDEAQHLKDHEEEIKIVATLHEWYPQVIVPKTIPKHAAKKQDIELATAIATLSHKSTFLALALENTIGLWQSE